MLLHGQAANVADYGVTMNLKFWKKKAAAEAEAVPGALARIKAHVAALIGRIKPPQPFKAEVPASAEAGSASAEALPASAENPAPEPDAATLGATRRWVGVLLRMKSGLIALFWKPVALPEGEEQGDAPPARRLNLLAVGALLLALLLIAFGYAAWTIARSSPDAETDVTQLIEDKHANDAPLPIIMPVSVPGAVSDVPAVSAPADTDAASAVPHAEQAISSVAAATPVSHVPVTEVEALRQKSAELEARLEALKKAEQSSSVSVKLYPGNAKGGNAGGVATVGNSDPKAAAMTLKEAIEAMNAGTGNDRKQPAR
jgi:hypothetical protein